MKRLILFKLLLVSVAIGHSQNQVAINNFYTENQELIWKKVFETQLTCEQLYSKAKDSGLFDKLEKDETKIRAELIYIDAEPLTSEHKPYYTPEYIVNNFIQAFILIETKPGKYRVTLKRIMLTEKSFDSLTNFGSHSYIEKHAFKYGKGQLTNNFIKHGSKLLDDSFSQKLDFNLLISDDNW